MGKINTTFGYLGYEFQTRLLAQILTDHIFAESIIDIIEINYFDEGSMKKIMTAIKDAWEGDEIIPDYDTLRIRLRGNGDAYTLKYTEKYLDEVIAVSLHDGDDVQKKGMDFCKQQELKKVVHKLSGLVEKGAVDRFDEAEELIKKVLEIGNDKDKGTDVLHNMENVLSDDFRNPIPTGITGLDIPMNGGLAKGELAVILAPFGVGKTTMITKIANSAMDLGFNVIQIFFEDMPKVIQRKHLSCWSGIELSELSKHKDELSKLIKEKEGSKGKIMLKKFPSDGTTITMIRSFIRQERAKGFKPDLILLDYIDVVAPTKEFKNSWDAEGNIMRQFETMLVDFDVAGWTAVQGNRSSIKAEIVESDQMGGSIKRGQIGHFIVSIAKTLIQKENNTATMAILKSRFGKDGIVFEDIVFNNGTMDIDVTKGDGISMLDVKNNQKDDGQKIILNSIKKRNELLGR